MSPHSKHPDSANRPEAKTNSWPLPPRLDLDFTAIDAGIRSLTARQRAILAWIAFGKKNPEIADLFNVSPKSIERDATAIFAAIATDRRHRAAAAFFFWLPRAFNCQNRTGTLEERSRTCPICCSPEALLADDDSPAEAESFPFPLGSAIGLVEIGAALEKLNPRRRAVLAWIANGATNRKIAETLAISLKTVERDITRILDTLDAESRHAAAAALLHWNCCLLEEPLQVPATPPNNAPDK